MNALMNELATDIFGEDERPTLDRKQKHEFRASAPTKDIPCVFQGYKQKFRKSTQYTHFVAHYEQHHRKKVASA